MNGSVDTVRFQLQDYRIDKNANIVIRPGLINYATGEQKQDVLYRDQDHTIEGADAIRNTGKYNWTLNGKGCFLSCSIPKIHHGVNDKPVDRDQVKSVVSFLQTDLKENGIHTDIETSRLSRVDLVKQDRFRYLFTEYSPVFSMLNGKKQFKRTYGDTITFGNRQRECCIYDKGRQVQEMDGMKDVTPTNQVRAELRLLFHRTVTRTLEMDTTRDLVTNYDQVTDIYNREIRKYLTIPSDQVNGPGSQYVLFPGDPEQEMNYVKELNGGRFGMKEATMYMTGKFMLYLANGMTVDGFIDLVVRVSDYKNKRELRTRLRRYTKRVLLFGNVLPNRMKELYDEIYLRLAV